MGPLFSTKEVKVPYVPFCSDLNFAGVGVQKIFHDQLLTLTQCL